MPHYFDRESFGFSKARPGSWGILGAILKYTALAFSLAVVYYVVFASVVGTDRERRLARENRMYEKLYPQMLEREGLVGDVIRSLKEKDYSIYRDIFDSEAPVMDPGKNLQAFVASDTLPDSDYVKYIYDKSATLMRRAGGVESNFREISRVCEFGPDSLPPLSLPLEKVSYAQIGASTGQKVNPFYKVAVPHGGLDIIAPQGDPVLAVADGVVSDVRLSRKGMGNVVEITHRSGYVTRYCHLADIEVRRGQLVRKGRKLGNVGISGTLYAPHLHYEVLYGGEPLNPVNFFFASVTPDEYANMVFMSASTGQSLD